MASERLQQMDEARRSLCSRLAPLLGCSAEMLMDDRGFDAMDLARDSWTQSVRFSSLSGLAVDGPAARLSSLEARVEALELELRSSRSPAASAKDHHRLSRHMGWKKEEKEKAPLPREVEEEPKVSLGIEARSRVLSELMSTEAAFILRLRVVVHVFSEQLSAVMRPEELEHALQVEHVKSILALHLKWYRRLLEATKEWDVESTCVGEALGSLFPELPGTYSYYVANFNRSNDLLVSLNSSATSALMALREHPQVGSNDLVSHMIAPVQRAPRLPLLLRELLDVTPESHPDHDGLERALEGAVAATAKLNSLADDIAAHRQVSEICNRLTGDRGQFLAGLICDSSQISSNRHFRGDIKIRAVNHPVVDRLHLLLFDDLAIFAAKRKGKLEALEHIWLREADPISVIQHGGANCLLLEGTSVAVPPKPAIEIKSMGQGAVSGFPGIKMKRASYKKSAVRKMRFDFSLLFRVEGGEDAMEELRANINSAVAAALERSIPGGSVPEPEFAAWGVSQMKRSGSTTSLQPPLPAKPSSKDDTSPRARRRRTSASRISISGVSKSKSPEAFGRTLSEQDEVPRVALECLFELLSRAPEEEGVFRVPGGTDSVNKLRSAYDDGKGSVAGEDIANVASLFLSYLRELPVEVLPPTICAEIQQGDAPSREVLSKLSRNALLLLCGTCYVLKSIADAEELTKMNASSLSTCVTPDLVYAPIGRENPIEALAGAARHGHAVQQLISEFPDSFPPDAVLEITSLIAQSGAAAVDSTATSSSTPRFPKLGNVNSLFSRKKTNKK